MSNWVNLAPRALQERYNDWKMAEPYIWELEETRDLSPAAKTELRIQYQQEMQKLQSILSRHTDYRASIQRQQVQSPRRRVSSVEMAARLVAELNAVRLGGTTRSPVHRASALPPSPVPEESGADIGSPVPDSDSPARFTPAPAASTSTPDTTSPLPTTVASAPGTITALPTTSASSPVRRASSPDPAPGSDEDVVDDAEDMDSPAPERQDQGETPPAQYHAAAFPVSAPDTTPPLPPTSASTPDTVPSSPTLSASSSDTIPPSPTPSTAATVVEPPETQRAEQTTAVPNVHSAPEERAAPPVSTRLSECVLSQPEPAPAPAQTTSIAQLQVSTTTPTVETPTAWQEMTDLYAFDCEKPWVTIAGKVSLWIMTFLTGIVVLPAILWASFACLDCWQSRSISVQ